MAAAVSSIANGGDLFDAPHRARGGLSTANARRRAAQDDPPDGVGSGTAALLTEIMEQVVERGTGTSARVSGFTAAGKTGTSQKVIDGRYSTSEYNASFVGFIPSRRAGLRDRGRDRFSSREEPLLRRLCGGADLSADRGRGTAALQCAIPPSIDARAPGACGAAGGLRGSSVHRRAPPHVPRDRDAGRRGDRVRRGLSGPPRPRSPRRAAGAGRDSA